MEIIEDDELRELFKAETEEHTEKLEKGLLHLEKEPNDPVIIEEILREAHSLKGSARMLGVTNVESLAHRFEDIIKEAYRTENQLSPEKIDRLEGLLDDLRKMADEAITGKPCGVSLAEALSRLEPEKNEPAAKAPPAEASPPQVKSEAPPPEAPSSDASSPAESVPDAPSPDTPPKPTASTPAASPLPVAHDRRAATRDRRESDEGSYQISTIRVEPKKLDVLMTLVGELTVEKTHIERHLSETENVIALWEEISQNIEKIQQVKDDEHLSTSIEKMETTLYQLRQSISEDCSSLNRITEGLEDGIRALRLLPLSTVFNLFSRTVRDLSRELSKDINFIIEGGNTTADKHLVEMIKDPLMHLIRNSIYHGIEDSNERENNHKPATSIIRLRARRTAAHIVIEVEDDGKGLDTEAIKSAALRRKLFQQEELDSMPEEQVHALIFNSGFSTNTMVTDISGRGVGLNVVKANIEHLKGVIDVKSTPGQGCQFSIHLPITLATTRVFLIVVQGIKYALPVDFVRMVRFVASNDVFHVENRETIAIDGDAISVAWLEDLLEYSEQALSHNGARDAEKSSTLEFPCLFLIKNDQQLGIFVDELLDEMEVILKPPGALLQRVRNVSGVAILGSGEICVVLNPFDLMKTVQKRTRIIPASVQHDAKEGTGDQKRPLILLAEDSITTRTQEKRILESAGYDVVTAVDGQAAFNTLPTRPFDALISDVEMPNMDGLTLTEKIRRNEAYRDFPIILVTSLSTEENIKRGMEVGADAYITKASFNQEVLINTLRRLI